MAKTREPGLFGVELLEAMPEASRAAWDKEFANLHGHSD